MAAPMLRIEFEPLFTPHGPVFDIACLRIEKSQLLAGPAKHVLATHENYQWLRNGHAYTVLRIPCRCRVRFDDEAQIYGPFDSVRIQDGYIWADSVLAQLEESAGKWRMYSTGNRHSVVIVEPA